MKSIIDFLREALRAKEDEEPTPSVKRDRDSDDDPPIMKKYRTVPNHFPKVMPKEEEEGWRLPERVSIAPREHYIPITLEKIFPSTSTPSSQSQVKPLDKVDLSKHFNQPSTSSQWKHSTSLSGRSMEETTPRINRINSLSREKPKFFKSNFNTSSSTLKLKLSPKTSFLGLSRISAPSTSENRNFKRSTPAIHSSFSTHRSEASDPYEFTTKVGPREDYKYFKKSNKPTRKLSDEAEVIEISDSEDHIYYVIKEPKQHMASDDQTLDSDDDEEEEEESSCNTCRSKTSSRLTSRHNMPSHSRDKISRFKVPLSTSKSRLLSSFTPFWKSQRSLKNTSPKPIGRLKLSKNAKAITDRCFRLDDKKKYEELIKLSTGGFFRKNNTNRPSMSTLTDAQKRILDLTSIAKSGSLDQEIFNLDSDLLNGASEKSTPDNGSVILLSDNEIDQPASPDNSSTSSSVKIVGVNSLKQSFKSKFVSKTSWVDELNQKYNNKVSDKKQEAEDRILISKNDYNSSKDYRFKSMAKHLEVLKIDLSVELEPPKEVPLPELTNEQLNIIQHALRPNPSQQVLIQKFNLDITRRDINTLAGLNWLNDEVINFYMNLIMERSSESKSLPKVYAMNTFFYPKLMQSGQAGLKRWTRKVDIFSYNIIVAPIHLGVHWCMSIIDLRQKTIKYYDSMGGKNMECCDAFLKYLEDESFDKKRVKFDTTGWQKECVKDIPQQMNGSDCGMFSCTFAEFLSRDAPITFSQNDMPYLRRKMVLEIVQGKLLL